MSGAIEDKQNSKVVEHLPFKLPKSLSPIIHLRSCPYATWTDQSHGLLAMLGIGDAGTASLDPYEKLGH